MVREGGFEANGVVTLTTDFGTIDGYVGAMKGVILARFEQARVLDLSHDIAPQDIRTASHTLANACPYFPPGTVHVAVIDPGVGTRRAIIAALAYGQLFLAPDNGVLSNVIGCNSPAWRLERDDLNLPNVSRTFHGRDILAPTAAALAAGLLAPEELGPPHEPRRLPDPKVATGPGYVRGEVIAIDRFGNLVTNVTIETLPAGAALGNLRVDFKEQTISGISWSYADVEVGQWLAVVGSKDTIELSVREGSAAGRTGARIGDPVKIQRM